MRTTTLHGSADASQRHGRLRSQKRRAALILHGKLGSLAGRSIASGSGLDVVVISYATTIRHIIQANSEDYTIDTFGHSWSPEIGPALDALYKPKRSLHERVETRRNRVVCQDAATRLQQLSVSAVSESVWFPCHPQRVCLRAARNL